MKHGTRNLAGLAFGLALVWGFAGCHKTPAQDATSVDQSTGDPADANMAPAQALGQSDQNASQQQGEDYTPQQQAAPIVRVSQYSGQPGYSNGNYDNGQPYDDQAADQYASDLTDEQASEPPPPLPQYDQPPAPDPDYLWTPGYWAWSPEGYYWVPGAWVAAPYVGALWTPGYWGFVGDRYRFHHGFWGLHIGFYGGVNYGFGYFGYGYYGGYWDHDHFRYNTSVNRIDRDRIRNVYVHDVPSNFRGTDIRISFNGGRGGIQARPRAAEVAVLSERRVAPMQSQVQVQREASQNRQQFFNQNRGRPAVAVNTRPVTADRQMPAALPRVAAPAMQSGARGSQTQPQGRQGQPQLQQRPGQPQPENRGPQQQPQFQGRPGQSQPDTRGLRPQAQPQPQDRPSQPQTDTRGLRPQAQPQPQDRPSQPQTDTRGLKPHVQTLPETQAPSQPQNQTRGLRPQPSQPETRPGQAQPGTRGPQPQFRPQQQNAPAQPAPQARPVPQPQPQQRPEQARPQPTPQPRPQPEARPTPPPQPHPQPEARPTARPQPQGNDKNKDDKPRG